MHTAIQTQSTDNNIQAKLHITIGIEWNSTEKTIKPTKRTANKKEITVEAFIIYIF